MNEKFNVIDSKKNISKDALTAQYKEILEEAIGYIMVYKNKKANEYYCIANGFTQQEGVYASQLILKSIVYQCEETENETM